MDKITLTVKETSKILGIGINQTYALVRREDFPKVMVGKQYRIPRDELKRWIEDKSQHGEKLI